MRITELPQAASVAQTDDLAIDVPGGRTYRIPRSILAPAPFQATIPTGYWSGSGSDYYFTVSASNVTTNAQLYPFYDKASDALLNGPVWAIPADGSFTIHTSAIPSGTVTISVLLAGIVGEAQYQVLADVYSRAQVDTIVSQSTAKTVDSGVLATYTYGTLRYRLLTNFGVAEIIWSGNANIPDETTVNVTLPDKLKPAYNSYAVMRNGDMMEVRNETAAGVLRLTFGATPKAWSGASVTYIP